MNIQFNLGRLTGIPADIEAHNVELVGHSHLGSDHPESDIAAPCKLRYTKANGFPMEVDRMDERCGPLGGQTVWLQIEHGPIAFHRVVEDPRKVAMMCHIRCVVDILRLTYRAHVDHFYAADLTLSSGNEFADTKNDEAWWDLTGMLDRHASNMYRDIIGTGLRGVTNLGADMAREVQRRRRLTEATGSRCVYYLDAGRHSLAQWEKVVLPVAKGIAEDTDSDLIIRCEGGIERPSYADTFGRKMDAAQRVLGEFVEPVGIGGVG